MTSTVADRGHGTRNAALGLVACMLALVLVACGVLLYAGHRLSGQVDRVEGVFDGLTDRPSRAAGPAGAAVNILVLGTDRRSAVPTTGSAAAATPWVPGAQRSDAMMVVHIDADRRGASVISIPRDSWVEVPGHGPAKINAAFSYAGPSLAVATVERLTGVRIDHLAIIDWAGFEQLTDAVGGVEVTIPRTVRDSARGIVWRRGTYRLDGAQALAYVGQRYGLARGDLDRVARQQAYLRSLLQASLHTRMRTDPKMVYDFLDVVTRHLSVDAGWSTWSMARLALSLRDLRSADVRYLTAPVRSLGRVERQSVVFLDPDVGAELWRAVRADRVQAWTERYPELVTGTTVS